MNFSLDTLIAIIALVLAVVSFVYTWYTNDRYSIEVTECCKQLLYEQNFISFEIANTSSRSLSITSVNLHRGYKPITDNGFDPMKYGDEQFDKLDSLSQQFVATNYFSTYALNESENFHKTVLLLPNEKTELSYYVDEIPNSIEVSCNKKIHCFKNKKLFMVDFDEID